MQLLATTEYYFIKSMKTILKCCRKSAKLSITNHNASYEKFIGLELAILNDVQTFGNIFCCIGKITVECVNYLLLATECTSVANLEYCNSIVYRIDKVCALPILLDGFSQSVLFTTTKNGDALPFTKLKNHHKKIVKYVSDKVSQNVKFIHEIVRFINESTNFYFSFTTNLTQTVQKHNQTNAISFDQDFFWNRELLKNFFDDNKQPIPEFKEWIIPVIYGYVCQREMEYENDAKPYFTLISRRSVKRAGVRYLRRGIDDNSNVANFVETEFIICVFGHCLSYVQIRGSVPIFWSQKGYRFRPPLSIDRSFDQSFPIFKKNVDFLMKDYGNPLVIINLVEQQGRELCLGESFLQHVLELNSSNITFISFDFHQNCRTLNFQKINDVVKAIEKEIANIGFCWLDKNGQMVRQQKGIVRTNCVDCLDRTNVIQSALSQAVCLIQAKKLGLIDPGIDESDISKLKYINSMNRIIKSMWADHGDSISKQYAGTNALKSDVTRDGQRKLFGFMKDSYNSASRYYLSQFHDANRQRIIDSILSGISSENNSLDVAVKVDLNMNNNNEGSIITSVLDLNSKSSGKSNSRLSYWYDETGIVSEDLVDDEIYDENDTSGPSVKFDAEVDSVTSDWILVDALKQRITDSKTRILIL